MSSKPQVSLGAGVRIAFAMYVTGVVILPLVGTFVKAAHPAASLRVLAPVLAAAAVADYIVSLWMEQIGLRAMAKQGTASGTGVLVIIIAAFGLAIALYGFILSLLGSARWPLFFYVLCFIHGVHLLARGQSFPRPTES